MINRIIDFSVKNKFIVGLLTLLMVGLGIWSLNQVPIDAQPDITNNQVQVITQAPNLGTEDIEQFVTYPVEVAMSNLPGVKEIRSVSRFGLSVVTIVFEDEMGTYLPRQLVGEKLNAVKDEIPQGFGEPFMGPITTGLGEIYQYTLEVSPDFKDQYSPTELRTIQDWIVKRQMAMVPGVVEVNGVGGRIKQFEVAIDPEELRAIGLSISDVFTALERNNQNTGGAYIERNHQANFIRGEGLARSVEDLEKIVIENAEGVPITIGDVAEVRMGSAVRYGALTKNGKGEAVGGMIMMLKGANSNEVIEHVKQRITQIEESLPPGVSIEPFLDRSELIEDTTSTVTNNLLEGGLIVIFVLVLLLGNWRGGLIVASTIPLSLLFAFILMHVFDVWANLMSLGAIDFGIIVDGAVIIVESTVFTIHQRMRKKQFLTRSERDGIASSSAKKMMNSAFFGQLIILIVFLPILALEGVEGKMFKPMALTFIFAMLGAMILCLTYVPMISALFLKEKKGVQPSVGDKFVWWLERRYEPLLQRSIRRTKLVIGLSIALFTLAVFLFSRMGGEFIPQLDEGDIAFHIILKPGSSLEEGISTSTRIEKLLLAEFPEIEQVVSRFGVSDVPTDPMPMDLGDSFIILKDKSEWTSAETKDELIAKIEEAISVIPGVSYEFTQPVEMRFNELLTGVREDIAVKLYGEDLDVLASKAQEMGRIISKIPGVSDLKVEATTGLPQITIHYNRNKLAQYGLDIVQLNKLIEAAFAGAKAGVIFQGEKRFDLVVRLKEEERRSIEDIRNLYVSLDSGAQIPLKEVADISYQPGPMQISRDNTNRRTYVGINIRERDVKSVVEDIQQALKENLNLPPGYYIRYGGAFENFERANKRLQQVVPIALLLIFVLIFFALKSFKQTLMIYVSIPLAAIGGVFALWIRDMPFSISAGVGFIVLFGVAVLNGLVLVSGFNELKEEGVSDVRERLLRGSKRRIRPILLTALTDVLGFLPMAISSSAGAEVQRPLATVVIGGLITSTLLTLFVLPLLYNWAEKKKSFSPKFATPGLLLFVLLSSGVTVAQEPEPLVLTQEEAVLLAIENYPLLQQKELEIKKQTALKKSAWDLGSTQMYTSGEELLDGVGIYTKYGFQQQNMDLLGVIPEQRLWEQRRELALVEYELSELQVKKQVRMAWARAFIARQKVALYQRLLEVYSNLTRTSRLKLEVEAISELEYLLTESEANELKVFLEQAEHDYEISLYELNFWLGNEEAQYTVPAAHTEDLKLLQAEFVSGTEHPYLRQAEQNLSVAKAAHGAQKADLLPKFNFQYGVQEVRGVEGFSSYQAGISIPLLSGEVHADIQAAKIQKEIAQEEVDLRTREIEHESRVAYSAFRKWQKVWFFYRDQSLPLLEKQRTGSLLAFKEGAISFTELMEHLDMALRTELKALESQKEYLISLAEMKYLSED